jgi:LysM repeat protein
MKFKILLITVSIFAISTSLFAKSIIDSVGVKNNDGKKMVLFKVKAKDTYYSIGHRYNIKPEVLMKFNGKKKAILSIGTIVEVPTDMPFKKLSKGKETSETAVKETKKEKKARLAAEEAAEEKAAKKHKHAATEEAAAEPAPEQAEPERVVQQPAQQPVQQPVQQTVQENNTPPTQYKVSAGETLYGISKRFNTTVDDISKLNNLSSTNLSPGQVLLVRSGAPAAAPQQQAATNNTVVDIPKNDSPSVVVPEKDSSNTERHLNANKFGLYEKNERGVATWIDDASLDPNKKLVLHRTAPIGTVIKITNPMTNRTTFAKVVGRFTDSEATRDVIIVMTKNVADSLGALDKRFHVNISYGSPNE